MRRSSQGFECEINAADWITVSAVDGSVEIQIISDGSGEEPTGITIGKGQTQNLIDFLQYLIDAEVLK